MPYQKFKTEFYSQGLPARRKKEQILIGQKSALIATLQQARSIRAILSAMTTDLRTESEASITNKTSQFWIQSIHKTELRQNYDHIFTESRAEETTSKPELQVHNAIISSSNHKKPFDWRTIKDNKKDLQSWFQKQFIQPRPMIETHSKQGRAIAAVEVIRTADYSKDRRLKLNESVKKLDEMKIISPQRKINTEKLTTI